MPMIQTSVKEQPLERPDADEIRYSFGQTFQIR